MQKQIRAPAACSQALAFLNHGGGLIPRGLLNTFCMLTSSEVPLVLYIIGFAGREDGHALYIMIVSYTSISLTPRQCLFQGTTRLQYISLCVRRASKKLAHRDDSANQIGDRGLHVSYHAEPRLMQENCCREGSIS